MPLSWKEQINQHLRKLWKSNPSAIVAVVGVGNELMGDDAAGMLVVERLKVCLPADSLIQVVEGGPAPENCTGTLRRLKPELVIFVDAGNFGAEPGSIGAFNIEEAEGVSAIGHTLPLHVLGNFLEKELKCKCHLLLIQPEEIGFDSHISSPVDKSIKMVINEILGFSKLSSK